MLIGIAAQTDDGLKQQQEVFLLDGLGDLMQILFAVVMVTFMVSMIPSAAISWYSVFHMIRRCIS